MKYYKNLWLIIAFAFSMFGCSNQDAQSSDADKELMVTFEDSLSYSIGVNIGKNLPETEFNQELLIEGLTDYWNQEEPRLNAATRNEVLRAFNIMNSQLERDNMKTMSERALKLSRENKMKGQEFLGKQQNCRRCESF